MIFMVDFDAPIHERPGFSLFDMIAEWTDHLDANYLALPDAEIHAFDPALIAELVYMHSQMFRDGCANLGVQWDDFEGLLCLTDDMALLVEAGREERPTREDVDGLWSEYFQCIADNVFEIQDYLKNRS
jgi:hypothetical protein